LSCCLFFPVLKSPSRKGVLVRAQPPAPNRIKRLQRLRTSWPLCRWAYGTTPTAATHCGDAALRLRTFSYRRILNELTVGEHDVRSKPLGLTGAQRLELDLPPSRIGEVRSAIGSATHQRVVRCVGSEEERVSPRIDFRKRSDVGRLEDGLDPGDRVDVGATGAG
jgi:hypothetical protein